jgi:hypothetical protein
MALPRSADPALCYDFLSTKTLEEALRIFTTGLVCTLLAGAVVGQANNQPVLKPRANTPVQDLPGAGTEAKVAPDAPVITIQGLCDKGSAASDCRTVVTRAEFEKIINALQPNMPKPQQKQFATRYVAALFLAQHARELGLDQGPEFDEQMYLQRLQLLAKLAGENMQKEAAKVSDAEIEDYYKQHTADFKVISYDKLFVPKQRQSEIAGLKLDDPEAQKKREASQAAMKEEAGKLRTRAAAGEDFAKLQQEAYDFAGQNLKAGNPRVDNIGKARFMPPGDASIFDLKPGEVSQVFDDPQAYMVYKVITVKDQSLAEVRDEIRGLLQRQKILDASQALQKTATDNTKYDDAYFAVPAAPSLRNPGEAPAPSAPANGTQAPGKK